MGRSRRRERAAAAAGGRGTATAPPQRARDRKAAAGSTAHTAAPGLRRTLGLYLGGALVFAVAVLVATVALAPSWAPWIVLLADASLSLALFTWMQGRLAGLALSDEDRLLQTLATGLLVMGLLFAVVAAVVLTVA